MRLYRVVEAAFSSVESIMILTSLNLCGFLTEEKVSNMGFLQLRSVWRQEI